MTGSADLDEIKAVEVLKARYCRCLDTKDWDGFRGVFTEDFQSDTTDSGGSIINGRDEFVAFVRKVLDKRVTVHQVQQPEIVITSPTTACGVWAMQDVVRFAPGVTLHGFGHYDETYEKADGQWRIKSSTLTRLREEIQTPVFSVFVSDRLRRRLSRAARRRTSP
ncbi:MAG TPA: nuclear transport factor 2 family protein [Mycobacteriales bacterium]|jgi:uncharacterized protein (TIGR02246 family)|nr:nuclear transport factor 2 family protein [Mycobacteriales bacterium]